MQKTVRMTEKAFYQEFVLIVIIRLRCTGIIEQPAEENINEQGDHHDDVAAYHGPVALNAVFSEVAEACDRREEKKKCRYVLPVEILKELERSLHTNQILCLQIYAN